MIFLIHSHKAKAAILRFEEKGRCPNDDERRRLEQDLAELEAAATRVRLVLAVPAPRPRRGALDASTSTPPAERLQPKRRRSSHAAGGVSRSRTKPPAARRVTDGVPGSKPK